MKKMEKSMSSILKIVFIVGIAINLYSDDKSCHLIVKNEKIYKVCGNDKNTIPFKYQRYIYNIQNDDQVDNIAILWRTPKSSEMRDERLLIFDYKNMMIYDNIKCLKANLIMLNEKNQVELHYFDKDEIHIFHKANFESCKQPISRWVNRPLEW